MEAATRDTTRLSLDQIRTLARDVLRASGLSRPHVEAVAETIVAAERDHCRSHGLYRLLVCAHSIRAGKVVPDAEPVVHDDAPGLVRVDGRGGFAQLAFDLGRHLLAEKATRCGVAAMAINSCVHFAALWPEVETLARAGLVALAFTPSHAWVAPAGGNRPLLGTNPMAFGWPRPQQDPFVFDFATSAVARGEIELHRRSGKAIPLGWAVDRDGAPTTDPDAALTGAMLTFGGHKGSALSAMIELVAGPLIGDLTSQESSSLDAGAKASPHGGELILAIDPRTFMGADAKGAVARAERLFDGMLAQGARLPSSRRYEARRASLADGVVIDRALLDDIRSLIA